MSGIYPNGGYRTVTARELSMPSKATPPTVTAQPVSASGNTLPPLQGEIIRPRSGDLRGKMTPGLAPGSADNRFDHRYKIRLPHIADGPEADKLDWKTRDRLRANIQIDLKGNEYRLNGQGAVRRAAIRAIRALLKGAKRIPRNIYSAIVQAAIEAVLDQYTMEEQRQADGEPYVDMSTGVTDLTICSPRRGLYYNPGNSACVQGVQATPKPLISNNPRPWGNNRFWAEFEFLGMDGVGRYHYATTRIQRRAVTHVNTDLTLIQNYKVVHGALNAPYPTPATKVGSSRAPNREDFGGLPYRQKDKKFYVPWLNTALKGAMAATELGDSIDCLYEALPKHERYGRSYLDKANRIKAAFGSIDWGAAVGCLVWNHVTDPLYGRAFDAVDKASRKVTPSGIGYGTKPTYEGTGLDIEVVFK